MAVTCCALLFKDVDMYISSLWSVFLIIAYLLMILYEIYWIRYFKSHKTMKDFYSSFLGIPVAGATLPVLAFLSLGIYAKNFLLILATIILGIGHISIHLSHKKEINFKKNKTVSLYENHNECMLNKRRKIYG